MFDSMCPRPSLVNIHHCCFVIIYFIYKMLLKKVAVINPHTSATFQSIDSLITPEHVDKIAAFFAECNTISSEISSLRKQYAAQDYT